jgi:protein TonB
MPLRGSRRTEALSGQPPRRRPWRLRLAILISLLIHAAIGFLLLVTIRREGQPEQLPPPSAVTMLFETGRKSGPTLPNPDLQATPPAPPAPETPPVEEVPLPVPPRPPPAQPPPVLSSPPPTPAAPTPAAPTAPPIEVAPPPPPPEPAPEPIPPPPPPPRLAPKPPPSRQAPGQPVPPKASDFPAPMNFSLGSPPSASSRSGSPSRQQSRPHVPGTIDMSLGPASKGTADLTPFSNHDDEALGADWRNALSRWVAEHAYYPEQARRDFEEGDAKVHVIAEPNGRVKEVELIGKSGSMWLDLALLSLFRDQHIPALPPGEKEPIEFNFTMHYVLVRQR